MYTFSFHSQMQLVTCAPELQQVFNEVIKQVNCTVIEGHRGREGQEKAFNEGKTQLHWPYGKHNAIPSNAVDVAPWPIDWQDRERFTYFAGFVLGVASRMGISLRWGGDWNGDWQVRDNRFDDLVHFELLNRQEI